MQAFSGMGQPLLYTKWSADLNAVSKHSWNTNYIGNSAMFSGRQRCNQWKLPMIMTYQTTQQIAEKPS